MSKIYFTIAGTCFFYGSEFMERGMRVKLIKEPDNEVDKEAVKVEMPGLGKVGYVANSIHTVLGESMSAGRLYDKIGDKATGKVLYTMEGGVVCVLEDARVCPADEDPAEDDENDEDDENEEEDDEGEDEYKNDAPYEQSINFRNNNHGSDYINFGSDCSGSAGDDFDEVAMMGLMPGIDVGMPGGFNFGGGGFGGF